mmetsp:Transcript_25466/g.74785  ORF Transcript_25466/g.74785 Transcript_25466/m.74785 type:complete len:549 (+) Transcript_25466:73-1719(+)
MGDVPSRCRLLVLMVDFLPARLVFVRPGSLPVLQHGILLRELLIIDVFLRCLLMGVASVRPDGSRHGLGAGLLPRTPSLVWHPLHRERASGVHFGCCRRAVRRPGECAGDALVHIVRDPVNVGYDLVPEIVAGAGGDGEHVHDHVHVAQDVHMVRGLGAPGARGAGHLALVLADDHPAAGWVVQAAPRAPAAQAHVAEGDERDGAVPVREADAVHQGGAIVGCAVDQKRHLVHRRSPVPVASRCARPRHHHVRALRRHANPIEAVHRQVGRERQRRGERVHPGALARVEEVAGLLETRVVEHAEGLGLGVVGHALGGLRVRLQGARHLLRGEERRVARAVGKGLLEKSPEGDVRAPVRTRRRVVGREVGVAPNGAPAHGQERLRARKGAHHAPTEPGRKHRVHEGSQLPREVGEVPALAHEEPRGRLGRAEHGPSDEHDVRNVVVHPCAAEAAAVRRGHPLLEVEPDVGTHGVPHDANLLAVDLLEHLDVVAQSREVAVPPFERIVREPPVVGSDPHVGRGVAEVREVLDEESPDPVAAYDVVRRLEA